MQPTQAIADSPAIRADECSRITRTIAAILRRSVFANDDLAHTVAREVAAGLISEYGGGPLYVPLEDRRWGGWALIEADLRRRLTADQLAPEATLPRVLRAEVAAAHRVSERTVARVHQAMRER